MDNATTLETRPGERTRESTERFRSLLRLLAARRRERLEVRRWLRRNPPSLGRATGAKV